MIETFDILIPTTNSLRTIRVYDPGNCTKDHPCDVLFMHDAQNIFDDEISYHEVSWRVIEGLKHTDTHHMMIVGIDNSPTERMNEYSPYETNIELKDRFMKGLGGKGFIYIDFIVKTLLPKITTMYQTSSNYYMVGSSMGAYISMFAAMRYPSLFKGIGCLSIASWFNEKQFLSDLNTSKINTETSFFITVGNDETSSSDVKEFPQIYINNSKSVYEILKQKLVKHLSFNIVNGKHNEKQWMQVFPDFLNFIKEKKG